MALKQIIGEFYWNLRSKKFDEKLLVIESDDWGSLRTESRVVRMELNKISSRIKGDPYSQLDGIASSSDLSALYEILSSVKVIDSKHPIFTANFCMANPDFEKIKKSNFEKFYFERFDDTIKKQPASELTLDLWTEGIGNRYIQPQLHGREHLHALAWLSELRRGNDTLLKAFDQGAWGVPYEALDAQRRGNLQAALDVYGLMGETEFQHGWIEEGARFFEDYFGFKSKTFIAPAYTWSEDVHKQLANAGVESLQGIKLQYQPYGKSYRKSLRFTGEKCRKSGLYFFPRNVFFEPSLFPEKDWYSETLNGVRKAFEKQQPAIIGSHRINYIGKLEEANRTENLKLLKQILQKVVELYPDVRFISSDQLLEVKN